MVLESLLGKLRVIPYKWKLLILAQSVATLCLVGQRCFILTVYQKREELQNLNHLSAEEEESGSGSAASAQ